MKIYLLSITYIAGFIFQSFTGIKIKEVSFLDYQATFERYEIKYLLSLEEKAQLLDIMAPYMKLADYGRPTIRTIYYDTDNFRLIRRAMEQPAYK